MTGDRTIPTGLELGDIVAMTTQAHPIMGKPYEVIGRVERDGRGFHAGNRYLSHCWDIRIVEKNGAAA